MTSRQVTRQVSLSVNGAPLGLDHFVQSFIDHVTSGIMEALKDAGEIKTLDLAIEGDRVRIIHNKKDIPLNPFVTRIIRNTLTGMVSSLKGVSEISKIDINIRK